MYLFVMAVFSDSSSYKTEISEVLFVKDHLTLICGQNDDNIAHFTELQIECWTIMLNVFFKGVIRFSTSPLPQHFSYCSLTIPLMLFQK